MDRQTLEVYTAELEGLPEDQRRRRVDAVKSRAKLRHVLSVDAPGNLVAFFAHRADEVLAHLSDLEVGRIYEIQHRFDEAEAKYRAILSQDPHNPHVALRLADTLFQKGFTDAERGAEIIELYRKAVQGGLKLNHLLNVAKEHTEKREFNEAKIVLGVAAAAGCQEAISYLRSLAMGILEQINESPHPLDEIEIAVLTLKIAVSLGDRESESLLDEIREVVNRLTTGKTKRKDKKRRGK